MRKTRVDVGWVAAGALGGLIMVWRQKCSVALFVMLACTAIQALAADPAAQERLNKFREVRDSLYAHMKRYGINRESVAAMRNLYEMCPPYSEPHVSLASEKLLSPGEHYRIEMDEYILTMKVPDGQPVPGSWIWPYTDTRTPDLAMEKFLVREKGAFKVANLGWYLCRSIFSPGLIGSCDILGVSMSYRILKPEEIDDFSTPEKLWALSRKIMRNMVVPQEEVEKANRSGSVLSGTDRRIHLDAEIVVINGRVWIRDSMDTNARQSYTYVTALLPNRMIGISFGIPQYDHTPDSDPSSRPATVRRAFALMNEMLKSLRIAKVDDDGSPDAFVIERVEPGPLPVREQLPAAH